MHYHKRTKLTFSHENNEPTFRLIAVAFHEWPLQNNLDISGGPLSRMKASRIKF